ncbi:hypothetical protein CH63R_02928 [Colletotrichum higginsianum IMI 349063]|uniref:Uncharacterized protein n=1 Tax=Colletotrichum higginsianum (strain IMI 349063) TaxID=759273 RepID=A0A1B7YQG9_COLHI|nr:hypothetical protein CH63R_02928 [Colletotrichum higginsianum IMI 349063]OBR14202.1 hypothetical protein CH63R_02928 [Colletotrichum higginsianum IMI 349063]
MRGRHRRRSWETAAAEAAAETPTAGSHSHARTEDPRVAETRETWARRRREQTLRPESQLQPRLSPSQLCQEMSGLGPGSFPLSLPVPQSPSQVSQSSGLSLTSVSPRWTKFRLEAKPEMGKNSLKEGRE